jgi:feruloyl esterase
VERGQAPESIMGHHIENDARGPVDPPLGFDPATSARFSRPLFPYPDYAEYAGKGDWKDANSYRRRRVN